MVNTAWHRLCIQKARRWDTAGLISGLIKGATKNSKNLFVQCRCKSELCWELSQNFLVEISFLIPDDIYTYCDLVTAFVLKHLESALKAGELFVFCCSVLACLWYFGFKHNRQTAYSHEMQNKWHLGILSFDLYVLASAKHDVTIATLRHSLNQQLKHGTLDRRWHSLVVYSFLLSQWQHSVCYE